MIDRQSSRRRRLGQCSVVFLVWVGANWAALASLDIYESRQLEAEFGIAASAIRNYESRTLAMSRDGQVDRNLLWYRFRPPSWMAAARTVPLVVFLHGGGESGADNVRQLRSLPQLLCNEQFRRLYPCAVLAPQCPKPGVWAQRLDTETDLLDGVLQMIDEVSADSRIDPDRIYLIGLSMGGYGVWELAMRAPDRFAAVVPICGGGDESRAARLSNVALWAVHGADDTVISVSESRTMIAAVESAGGRPRYLELPGVGHDCWTWAFREDSEVLTWMFRQVRKSASAVIENELDTRAPMELVAPLCRTRGKRSGALRR